MSGVATAIVGGAYIASKSQSKSASQAAAAQVESSEAGIAEQKRQFDKLTELMSPYVTAGSGALGQQLALLGLEEKPRYIKGPLGVSIPTGEKDIVQSPEAQKAAYAAIQQSPEFLAMQQQGENALLQQASATGGLRGGNIQGALAQFRPGLLNQLVQQRYANLAGITSLGQASAAGQAGAGMQSAGAIGNLLAQQGAARAGGIIGQGSFIGNAASLAGIAGGLGWKPF